MKNITIQDLFQYKFLSNPTFSPSGKNRCFTLTEIDKEKNAYQSFIYQIKNGLPLKLTGLGKESSFIFLDDDNILFPGNREDKKDATETIFYKLSLNGGEAQKAFSLPFVVNEIYKLSGQRYLCTGLINTNYPDYYKMEADDKKKVQSEIEKNKDYRELYDIPYVFNGQGFINGIRTSLFYVDLDKNEIKRITTNFMNVDNFFVYSDESGAFFVANDFKGCIQYDQTKLFYLNLETFSYEEVVLPNKVIPFLVATAKDFSYLYAPDFNRIGSNSNGDFYLIDKDLHVSLLKSFDNSVGSSVLSDCEYGGGNFFKTDNDILYFTITNWEKAPIYRIDKKGVIEEVYSDIESVISFDINAGNLFMVAFKDMQLEELFDNQGQISSFNEENQKDKYVAKPELVEFKNENNIVIHGFVLKPIDYEQGKKYPAVLDIHGGPKCAYGKTFFHEMQVWASMGYFVLFANPTGSDGRGDEFSNIRGKYGTVDYNDLMTFVDECLNKYKEIDQDNLFETGGSYGGFMTNWIIGHTDRFKACASQRSISNFSIMYGVSDIGIEFTYDQNLSDPLNNPEKCWWHSPLKYANNVKTPTLFIHSDEDYRCPLQEGLSMFTALKVRGVESKMVIFKGENHELSRSGKPLHRERRLYEISDWFENHRSK
ncbi:MAG: S9 family peptidase [Bacillales bacterium]|nr:S9 family peptidase [Bacillales bacterium]